MDISIGSIPGEHRLNLATEDMDTRRAVAVALVRAYLPCSPKEHESRYEEIAREFGGVGTTCGYLPHWLWYRLGCRDPKWCNRTIDGTPCVYKDGKNIAAIFNEGRGPFVPHRSSTVYLPGDVFYVYDGVNGPAHNPNSEHVGVLLEDNGTSWLVGHGGQIGNAFQIATLKRSGSRLGSRVLVGKRPLEAMPVSAPADLYCIDNPYDA
jgi:hypothetical protein